VNVGSITAMAADGGDTPVVSTDEKNRTISIKYIDKDGKAITDDEFLSSALSSVKVLSKNATVSASDLKLPENYTLDEGEGIDTVSVSDSSTGINVKVKNEPKDSVKVKYIDQDKKDVTDATLSPVLTLKDITKQVKSVNLSIPDGYEFSSYKDGLVTLQKITRVDVNIIFVDENNNPIGKTSKITNKNPNEAVSETEVTVPNGYTVLSGQSVTVGKATDSNKGDFYSAKIKVKKNAPTTSHAVSKPGKHGGYVAQRLRISFIDQDGNEVGFQQLNGKASFDTKISAPNGYSLVNANEANIKFDKSGNKDLKLKVTKNKPVSTMEEGIVTTNSGDFKHLYTIDGKDITNRGLSGDSKWYTDQYATINGEKMFRVATNEWVKATDVYK